MPKLSSLVNLSTVGKVASGVMLGGISTAAVQLYTDSSEFSKDPQRAEMREEQKKKLDFEVQQRSEELEKKEQELKALEATLAKQQAALTEERLAVQQMKTSATEVAASETAVVETVQQVAQTEEPTDVEPEKPKADVVQVNNTPKRPAVFDGGNKEKPVATTNKNNASEPSVAFGSSGDVVTIEKGGAVFDAETDRLRKEIEDLRRRLAEKDGSPKEEALRAREERLRERERALSEKLWKNNMQSKARQTDDALFEAASGDDDPFEGGFGKKAKTAKSGKVVDFSKMEKEEIQDYTAEEGERLSKDIAKQEKFFRQLVSVDETVSVGTATKEEQEKIVSEKIQKFNAMVKATVDTLPSDVAQISVDQILRPLEKEQRAAVEKNLERVKQAMPFLKDVKTLGALRAAVSAYTGNTKEKPISPQKYADLMEESAVECAREIKNPVLSNDAKKREADAAKEFKSFCDTKDASNKKASKIVEEENAGGGVDPAQAIADLKKEAAGGYDNLFEGKNGLLKGFRDLQHDWEQLVVLEKTVKSIPAAHGIPAAPGVPGVPRVPGVPAGDNPLILSDGKEAFARFLSIVDPNFEDKNRKNTEAHDKAVQAYSRANQKVTKAAKAYNKAVRDGRDVAEKNRLLNEKNLAEMERSNALAAAGTALNMWKAFRMNAFNDPEKKLLSDQQRWLDCGFEDELSIDFTITDLEDRLSKDAAQPTGAALLRQRRISGTAAAVTRLTDPEKKKYKEFLDTAKSVKKRASALKEKFNRAKETKEAVENVSLTPVTNPGTGEVRYVVSIPDGSLLSSASLYSCLLSLAPVITELTIEKLGYESAGKPFLHFMKLCPRFALLEKLCIKGSFAEDVKDSAKKGFFRQYESAIRSDNERLGSLCGSGIPSNAKGFFFRAISLIPNLKAFEMYCVGEDGTPEDTKTQLDDPREIWAAVMPLESVRLPSCTEETYVKLFDYLTHQSGPFKTMKLCTRCFGDMMRTPGFPQGLYRLLSSGKARVEWFGDLTIGTKAVEAHTIGGRSDRNIAALESSEKEEEIIGIVKKRKVDGKNLADWVSNDFSNNFVNRLDAYVSLCAVHSNAFTQKLIEYNAEKLNPVYVAAQRLVNLRPKKKEKEKAVDVTVNDPLREVVGAYPIIENGALLFGRKVPVDGSVLKKFTVPALLGLVLRERIGGENPVILGVEDGEAKTVEITSENGTTKTVAVKGEFDSRYMWYFPSYASSFWTKKSFGVAVESKDYVKLSSNEKDDLMQKAITESDSVFAWLSGCESISLNMDPAALRNFLKSLCASRTPLYWHYFVSNARTGKVEVHTAAFGDQRKLFDIFAEVVKAQPMHERLYEAFEKLRGANQTLFKVKQELAELKTKADEDPSDGSVSGKLSKKEKEVEAVERKYNDLKTEMDTCAAALEPVRVFMETNLPYVKEVHNRLREEAAKSAMVKQWVGGGRTIRYEDVANPAHGFAGLFGKPPVNTWKVKMPAFADIDGSDAASVNIDKVEAFVKSGELPIRSDNGFYVVLTVEAVPGAGGVPGAGAAPKTNALAKAKKVFDPIRQWKMFGKNIMYRDAATRVLSTKILPGGVVKVKMVDPKFASINGRDVSEPNFLKAVETLVTQKHLTPELDPALRRYVVVLDTESFLPPGIGNPAIAQWLADGHLIMCRDVVTPAMLFDKPLAAGTYKVKMTAPAFKAVNGRDVTKVRPEEIRKLVFLGKLKPERNTSKKKYVVVLDVEK